MLSDNDKLKINSCRLIIALEKLKLQEWYTGNRQDNSHIEILETIYNHDRIIYNIERKNITEIHHKRRSFN